MTDEPQPTDASRIIRVGTSGFSYTDWLGPFYPPRLAKAHMLDYYANIFDTVEINATYYAIPGPRSMESMLQKVGETFEFTVKAHQDMTHHRDRATEVLPRFLEALKPFAEAGKLGCVLLQFPFSFAHTPDNRSFVRFLVESLAPHRAVVEFRHRSWINEETMAFLRQVGAGYCAVDEPRLPGLPPPMAEVTAPVGYVRFHGRNKEKWWHHRRRKNATTIGTRGTNWRNGSPRSGSWRITRGGSTSSSTIMSVVRRRRTPENSTPVSA